MTVTEARTRYMRLQIECIDALELEVDTGSTYMTHLRAAIADAKTDYVASAVAEIAAMRDDLDAPTHQDLSVYTN